MKIVVAYSGGLDTSVLLTWLKEQYHAEIVAYCADLGQEEELDGLEEKALKTGASVCYVDDLREEFARDFIFPMIRGNALYEGLYYLGTSIARPLIAKRQIEIARMEKADAVAHGATGKGNDQVRFELTFAALAPDIQVIAPWRTWDFKGRSDLIAYAKQKKIPVTVSAKKPYSMDRNLLHISYESGILEDPWNAPEEGMFLLTRSPEKAPDRGESVTLDFESGNCVAVNGKTLTPAAVVKTLNTLGGRHAIGRVDMVENRFVGMKSRGVYETPGGTILSTAHRHLETLTLDREVMHLRDSLIPKYSELIYNGFWYAPEREFIQSAIDHSQEKVTGTVRLKLYKGNIIVQGRKSPFSMYQHDVASMENDAGAYDQSDATGFIRLNGLRLKARAKNQKPYPKLLNLSGKPKAKKSAKSS
ncbi:MAG: argininosuccinate synthase [Candidatus Methylacidiphilales bacterium]